MFGEEVIFHYDDASRHRANPFKTFLQERQVNSITWPINSPDLHLTENLKMVETENKQTSMTRLHPAELICQMLYEKAGTSLKELKPSLKPEEVQQGTNFDVFWFMST